MNRSVSSQLYEQQFRKPTCFGRYPFTGEAYISHCCPLRWFLNYNCSFQRLHYRRLEEGLECSAPPWRCRHQKRYAANTCLSCCVSSTYTTDRCQSSVHLRVNTSICVLPSTCPLLFKSKAEGVYLMFEESLAATYGLSSIAKGSRIVDMLLRLQDLPST